MTEYDPISKPDKILLSLSDSLGFKFKVGGHSICGKYENKNVVIYGSEKNAYRIQMNNCITQKEELYITRETALTKIKDSMGFHDILTGDPKFDKTIFIAAEHEHTAISLLDDETRKLLLEVSQYSSFFEIVSASMAAVIEIPSIDDNTIITKCINDMIHISKKVSYYHDNDIKKRLMYNAIFDFLSEVRLKNLGLLVSNFPMDREITGTLRKLLNDESYEIQILSAKHLNKTGMEHLVKLLKSKKLNYEMVLNVIMILRINLYKKSANALKYIYDEFPQNQHKIEIIKTLENFADNEAESFLLEELTKNDAGLKIHIINALASCGTVKSVEALNTTKTGNPLLYNASRKAIARIQSRLGDVKSGWLSVTGHDDRKGALSIEDGADDGALSLNDKS